MDNKLKELLKKQFPSIRVLIVDDMMPNIKNHKYVLSEMGFVDSNISHAKDGLQGLLKLTKFQPELIITDWNMPMTDGLKMVQKIRATKAFADVAIIMITAEADKDLEQAKPYVQGILKKPYTIKDVEDQVFFAMAKYLAKKMQA
ncbi:MAG: response regulator [Desulfovibrio sp.]|nr:MAG: response regulator [Desulfovibrio sp.]